MKNTVSTTVVGIPNCDQVKAARKWLDVQKIPHQFRDFRAEPLSKEEILEMSDAIGPEKLFNKRSTTWRTLNGAEALSPVELAEIAVQSPTLLKRPVVRTGTNWLAGFDPERWKSIFRTHE